MVERLIRKAIAIGWLACSGLAMAGGGATMSLHSLLAEGRYAEIEALLAPLVQRSATDPTVHPALDDMTRQLTRARPVSAAPLNRWVSASDTGLSRLVRGRFFVWRAWKARGTQVAAETSQASFDRFHQLLDDARRDFEIAQRKLGPQCDPCHAGVLTAWLAGGERALAARHIDAALMDMGGGILTPQVYLGFLFPRWSGPLGDPDRFVAQFTRDFPRSPAIPLLQAALLVERGEALGRAGSPQQARPLLEEAVRLNPHDARGWSELVGVAVALNDPALLLQASDRAMVLSPDEVRPLDARAYALLQGPRPLEAVPFLERAVELGSSWALERLMPIVTSGALGFKPDRARAEAICRSAIDAGLPAGFACMGGLHFFGIGQPADKAQAFQWFVEAAQRGVVSSMTDVGIMLARGEGVRVDREEAIRWWLRAYRGGDRRAEGHLRGNLSAPAYAWKVTVPDFFERVWRRIGMS
ncbi:tetratricopeptide repeat protein [Ramlibacter sp. MAHUQ-53]|uniref:tetratricopeptide repeat protein n=1 Tax=unclassified Ramlibacter TaxID=2617605 RepID=UPI00362BCF55